VKRVLVALALMASGSAAIAADVSVAVPQFGTVRAGETAKIEWCGLPGDVEELELLLSVEGLEGPVRVTPQLSPRAGQLMWRVPNLPSRRARITIRFGLDGKEIESAPSARFEILPAGSEPRTVLSFREGEWWAQEASDGRFPGALSSDEGRGRIREAPQGPPCASISRPFVTLSRTASCAVSRETPPSAVVLLHHVLPRRPIEIPARI